MYDLAVIGLGPAGLEAVDIAIKNNLKVVAFEKNLIGGTCLNVGCIPTKAILHSAKMYKDIKNINDLGISINSDINFDWNKIINRSFDIVSKFTKPLNNNLSKKIKLINQNAVINYSNNEIIINDEFKAKNLIIATGSIPFELSDLKFDHSFILNSDDMFKLKVLPKSIAIIGSGAIGLEWAMILSYFGVDVKIIEKAPALAPNLDIDLQNRIERILKMNKIQFYKNDFVKSYKNNTITLNSSVSFEVDKILSAVGRKPILPDIYLNGELSKIEILNNYKTNFDNIYVTGDANRESMLAHSASYQAKTVMNKILFNKEIQKKSSPSIIYIEPEIASAGLREQDIKNPEDYEIKKILVSSVIKSWCDNAHDGLIKVIIKDDLIKGAHIVSKEADSLISIFNILIEKNIKIDEIKNMIFPHPSFSETILEVLKNG